MSSKQEKQKTDAEMATALNISVEELIKRREAGLKAYQYMGVVVETQLPATVVVEEKTGNVVAVIKH